MADKIKNSYSLIIEVAFQDGDTRTLTIRNPRRDLSADDIEDLDNFMKENNILIGDRDGSDFKKIKVAKIRSEARTTLDLD